MAKNIYVGGNISIPGGEITTNITASNISNYFTISNNSYYFAGNGSTFTSNNKGKHSSTAQTILTAKVAMSNFKLSYGVSSESNYDKFTFTAKGTTVANAISGEKEVSDYSVGSLAVGDQLSFKYTKDSSASRGSDTAWFQNMSFATTAEPVEKTNVALPAKTIYVGVNGIARRAKKAYIGVNGIARMFWDKSFTWVGWNNATWEDVYNLCKAKQSGAISEWPNDVVLGATKTVNLSTSVLGRTSYVMRIIGLDIDGDGVITFHSDTLSSTIVRGYFVCPDANGEGNQCGWNMDDSAMSFYNACEAKLYIKELNKIYHTGKDESTKASASVYVWLPSAAEMGYTETNMWEDDFTTGVNTPYPYYTSNTLRSKGSTYWLRGNRKGGTSTNPTVYGSAGNFYLSDRGNRHNIAPAFAIG